MRTVRQDLRFIRLLELNAVHKFVGLYHVHWTHVKVFEY